LLKYLIFIFNNIKNVQHLIILLILIFNNINNCHFRNDKKNSGSSIASVLHEERSESQKNCYHDFVAYAREIFSFLMHICLNAITGYFIRDRRIASVAAIGKDYQL